MNFFNDRQDRNFCLQKADSAGFCCLKPPRTSKIGVKAHKTVLSEKKVFFKKSSKNFIFASKIKFLLLEIFKTDPKLAPDAMPHPQTYYPCHLIGTCKSYFATGQKGIFQ